MWCVPHRLSHHKLKVLNFPSDKFQVFLSSRTGAFIVTSEPFFPSALDIPYGGGPRGWPGKQAHGSTDLTSSAPCVVLMGPSTIDQNIKDEPCAKHRALLGIFSSRYSSVSRGNQILLSIINTTPLVRVLIDSIRI